MTRGRTSRNSPAAIAAAEAQKCREDDLRIKNLLDDYCSIVEEKVCSEIRLPKDIQLKFIINLNF